MGNRPSLLSDLGELLKAVGRIIAGLALLNFKAVFFALRLCLLAELVFAGARLWTGFSPWMCAPLAVMALGAAFIVWTHELVKRTPISEKKLMTNGPFAVVRHPMYSGWCLVAIGAAILAGHWTMAVLAALQSVFMLSASCAEDEENAGIFGELYARYSRRVWLSGIFIGSIRFLLGFSRER